MHSFARFNRDELLWNAAARRDSPNPVLLPKNDRIVAVPSRAKQVRHWRQRHRAPSGNCDPTELAVSEILVTNRVSVWGEEGVRRIAVGAGNRAGIDPINQSKEQRTIGRIHNRAAIR